MPRIGGCPCALESQDPTRDRRRTKDGHGAWARTRKGVGRHYVAGGARGAHGVIDARVRRPTNRRRCYNSGMEPSQPSRSSLAAAQPDVAEVERSWAPRPKRLLIGFVLIAIGIGGSILNGVAGNNGPSTPTSAVHGPVATQVQAVDGLRVRAILLSTTQASGDTEVAVSFHNNGSQSRRIMQGDLSLHSGDTTARPIDDGRRARAVTTLRPGTYMTTVLRFPTHVAPGMTLLYAPSWSHGQTVRWLLWR